MGMAAADIRFAQPPESTTHVSERLVLIRSSIVGSNLSASSPTHISVVDQLPSMPCLRPQSQDPSYELMRLPSDTYQLFPINDLGSAPARTVVRLARSRDAKHRRRILAERRACQAIWTGVQRGASSEVRRVTRKTVGTSSGEAVCHYVGVVHPSKGKMLRGSRRCSGLRRAGSSARVSRSWPEVGRLYGAKGAERTKERSAKERSASQTGLGAESGRETGPVTSGISGPAGRRHWGPRAHLPVADEMGNIDATPLKEPLGDGECTFVLRTPCFDCI